MTVQEQEEFCAAAAPLMKWLAENRHPHHTVIVTAIGAELLEGQYTTGCVMDYVKG